jgi:hypothetical protein
MTYALTNEEKIAIITGQTRQIVYSKYTLEVQLLVENAVATPNETRISEINSEIARCEAQIAVLANEIESLS